MDLSALYLDTSKNYKDILFGKGVSIKTRIKKFLFLIKEFALRREYVKINLRQNIKLEHFLLSSNSKTLSYSTEAEHISEYDLNIPLGNRGFWLDMKKIFAFIYKTSCDYLTLCTWSRRVCILDRLTLAQASYQFVVLNIFQAF